MEFFVSEFIVKDLFVFSYTLIFFSLVSISFLALDYIQVLLYIEVALLSVNLNFVYLSFLMDDISSQIFVIFILSVAAAESAIALSIFIVLYRVRGSMMVF